MGATKEMRRCANCNITVGYVDRNNDVLKFIPNINCAIPRSFKSGKYFCKVCDKKVK